MFLPNYKRPAQRSAPFGTLAGAAVPALQVQRLPDASVKLQQHFSRKTFIDTLSVPLRACGSRTVPLQLEFAPAAAELQAGASCNSAASRT
jgi:hypothetical protein